MNLWPSDPVISAVLVDMLRYIAVVVGVVVFAVVVATAGTRLAQWCADGWARRTCRGGFIAPPIPNAARDAMRAHVAAAPDVDLALDDPLVTAEAAADLRAWFDLPARLPAHEFPPVSPGLPESEGA